VQCAGRLAELVAYTLDAMQHSPALRGSALHRQRDVELAHAALDRLEREYRKPPLFADLAQDLGTNQNKLKAVFKDLFGLTMADYCLERRMREAQLLLEATLTIAQVAERVGYEHQSSFTAAFRGHVGMSPREYRKHRAPFSLPLGPAAGTASR
jgi:AraC-like DNA-binding protein